MQHGLAFDRASMQGVLNAATCILFRVMLLSGRSLFRPDKQFLGDDTWPAAFACWLFHIHQRQVAQRREVLAQLFPGSAGDLCRRHDEPEIAMLSDLVDGKLNTPKLASKHACAVFADEAIRFINRKHD
jgi:hypothetical protein